MNVDFIVAKDPDTKACIVERFIRTIKGPLYRYFTHINSFKYHDVLQKFVDAYNKRIHRSIGMAHDDVNEKNILKVWENLQKSRGCQRLIKSKYDEGDHVRLSKLKNVFDKSYKVRWTDEVFKIKKRILRSPTNYRLADLSGEEIDGVFYEPEIQRVQIGKTQIGKKILKVRRKRGSQLYLVKWVGYSDKFNSWIDTSLITS